MGDLILNLLGSLLLLFLFAFFMYGWNSSSCETRAEKMGFQSEYGWQEGCMIRVKDRWIPIESYRTVGEAP